MRFVWRQIYENVIIHTYSRHFLFDFKLLKHQFLHSERKICISVTTFILDYAQYLSKEPFFTCSHTLYSVVEFFRSDKSTMLEIIYVFIKNVKLVIWPLTIQKHSFKNTLYWTFINLGKTTWQCIF